MTLQSLAGIKSIPSEPVNEYIGLEAFYMIYGTKLQPECGWSHKACGCVASCWCPHARAVTH